MNKFNLDILNLRDPELEQGTVNAGLKTEIAYQETLNGVDVAKAENEQNRYSSQLYQILRDTDEMFSKAMKNLDGLDKWYTPIAKAMLGIARSQLLSGIHLQLGLRSSSYTNPQTGSDASSSGFNIGF